MRHQKLSISIFKFFVGILCFVAAILLLVPISIIFEFATSAVEFLPALVLAIFAFIEIAAGVFLIRKRNSILSVKMRVVTVICVTLPVVLAMADPIFVRAHTTRSTAACINNLRQIDAAKQQWAIENNKSTNAIPSWNDILLYLNWKPRCPEGGTYVLGRVGESPRCSIGGPSHSLSE
ncbi:MAG TPA: hypothetical protein VFM25_02995 [Verrucomicrobiae bacterium]|nr:hypothetical protein [Verrucomicrobiae bacterium]